ncbi:MAG: hypothetical protein IJ856_00295, partial [Candidatus Methanomethylophilaceae archaeon]|nr:hypothetical protein [Candidatus Methanomethylophilaceae archaeon]
DGFHHMFLIPTCSSEIMAVDLETIAGRLSDRHGVDVIPVKADVNFLASKHGAVWGLYEAVIDRLVTDVPMEKGTVNFVARWFYGLGKDSNMEVFDRLLGLLGLRRNVCFIDYCDYGITERFCTAEFDLVFGETAFNNRLADRIAESTGRRRAGEVFVPDGFHECVQWVTDVAEYTGRTDRLEEAVTVLRREYDAILDARRADTEGRDVVVYALNTPDVEWQMQVARDAGLNVRAIVYNEGNYTDLDVKMPDYGDIPFIKGGFCEVERLIRERRPDVIVTNDWARASRTDVPYSRMGSRYFGLRAVSDWLDSVVECMRLPGGRGWKEGL